VRRLIISDIHANLPALEAVLRDSAGKYDEMVCLGDVVGYGASPIEAIDCVREASSVTLRGNHDMGSAGSGDAEWFNPAAQKAAMWTNEQLDDERRQWLLSLPAGPVDIDGCTLVHGAPGEEYGYIVDHHEALDALDGFDGAVCFFGHSHRQGGWALNGGSIREIGAPSAKQRELVLWLDPHCRYLLNPGAVGQPRDRDPRAAYLLWDSEQNEVSFRRVPYDVERAQRLIREAGLPDLLAVRLSSGT
jgi:diadenosine tetraphosphatase ApaH/serine/threonine PP2A family protein phosphatase